MTDHGDQPLRRPEADEAQASLRAQALVELLNAQTQIDDLVEAMRREGVDAALVLAGEQQLLALSSLQREFAEGRVSPAALQQAVGASVAAFANVAQQGRAQASAAREAEMAALEIASAEAHRTTAAFVRDFYEKRIFDPYLHFDTPEEERAYREREAAHEQAIRNAQAEDTPAGNLRAIQLAEEQLDDAGAHGAKNSPQFNDTKAALRRDRLALVRTVKSLPLKIEEQADMETAALAEPPAAAVVDPEILAAFKGSGTVIADQEQEGHGVTVDASIAAVLARV